MKEYIIQFKVRYEGNFIGFSEIIINTESGSGVNIIKQAESEVEQMNYKKLSTSDYVIVSHKIGDAANTKSITQLIKNRKMNGLM